ncbi:pyrophosphatase PpaX [Psychrobacillus sp. Sa2BUA9]|uniref:Pyrophosphatase PpaX n=1 Tax=Psychrobacillus faecigallinarum TaxID=2762235 RepID=A0ABR8RCY2_9BACI|nr:pyrophosphatase PpaX [Psychrobacillus faecigallinarum]MBD7945649.1 pyrophosphatase PpaX [Psychrobacillus faecigallinarum]
MNGTTYKALLFDLDGTLLNTNELIIESFLHILGDKFPGKYDRESVIPFLGPSLRETFDGIDPVQTESLILSYRAWNEEQHDQMVTAFDGVVETLQKLKNQGYKLAIVSTKRRSMIDRGLRLIGCQSLFDTIVGYEDVSNTKPDPEPILLALERLNVSKEDALMIGDNFHDIVGGQRAGVDTAAVAWSIKGEAFLATFNPTYMLQHISDLLSIKKGQHL